MFVTLVAMTMSFTSCDSDDDPVHPSIDIVSDDAINIDAVGGTRSINYKISDRVSDGEITATSDVDWMNDIRVEPTSGTITFTVSTNFDAERTGQIKVHYSQDNSALCSEEITVSQQACNYTYDVQGSIADGNWFSLNPEAHLYSFSISDKGRDEMGLWQTNAFYYNFAVWGEAVEDPFNITLPRGVFPINEIQSAGNGDLGSCRVAKIGENLFEDQDIRKFVLGEIKIEDANDGKTRITAVCLDETGEFHRVKFEGKVAISGLTKMEPVSEDQVFTAVSADSYFGVGDKEKMHCVLELSETGMSDFGFPINKRTLSFEVFFKYDIDGRLTPGVYPFTEPDPSGLISGPAGTIFPGRPSTIAADPSAVRGTHVKVYDGMGMVSQLSLINKGTLTIEEAGEGAYHITCDLWTEEGYKVDATYDGPLTIRNVPGRFSTLTEDYTLNLDNALAQGNYYGDVYGNGCSAYTINLNPFDGATGDGFMVEFVSKSYANYNEPIPDGRFTAAPEDQTARPGQFTRGYLSLSSGQILGTAFVGAYAGGGMVGKVAPAIDGEFFIKHISDDVYRMEFNFVDDRGHHWNGRWEGRIPLTDAGLNMFPVKTSAYKIFR